MKTLWMILVVAGVAFAGADAFAKAKEKANKTKCAAKLDNLGSSGCDGVAQPAETLIPKINRLLADGKTTQARKLTDNGIRQTRHRGHVTVLKLQATVEQCVDKMERAGDPREDIEFIRRLGASWIARIRAETRFRVDSFFDIWIE